MSYVNFNRALSRAQIEALTNATNGKIYFATDGGIYVGNASGTAELKANISEELPTLYAGNDLSADQKQHNLDVLSVLSNKSGTPGINVCTVELVKMQNLTDGTTFIITINGVFHNSELYLVNGQINGWMLDDNVSKFTFTTTDGSIPSNYSGQSKKNYLLYKAVRFTLPDNPEVETTVSVTDLPVVSDAADMGDIFAAWNGTLSYGYNLKIEGGDYLYYEMFFHRENKIIRLRKYADDSVKVMWIPAIQDIGAVSYNSQTLTSSQQKQARQNIGIDGTLSSEVIGDIEDPTNSWYTKAQTDTLLNAKQNTLVSGTNIKTVNGNSLLGSGNIEIEGGGVFWALYNTTTFNEIKQAILDGKTVYATKNQNVIDDWSQGNYVEDNVYTLSNVYYNDSDPTDSNISFTISDASRVWEIWVNYNDEWDSNYKDIGNVTGLASSTDDSIALFSGTSGKSIKQSTYTIDNLITTTESNIRRYTKYKLCSDSCQYYKIFFTSADGTKWVPASADASNSSTSAKVVNQRPINPFGEIIFANSNKAINANVNIRSVTTEIYSQYTTNGFFIGYSFNRTGVAPALDTSKPVYVKCTPQSNGSAIIDPDTPITQTLPTTADGKIYIYLGEPSGATSMYLPHHHPVYYYEDGAVRLWTNPNDTKNTAGATDTSSKIYLVGATSQSANPQTYSDNEVYATSGVLTTKSVQVGGGSATMQYDATNACIKFVFA